MQYNAGIGSKSFIGARRTLPALSQNKTYTLNARLLKSTCIVNNSIIVRVRSALNGTILGTTSYTIATNTAASVPITMNFVAPSNLSTAIVEIERAASTNCPNIQIDDVELIEQRTVWEDFATLDNTSGYSANTGSNVVLSNTNQSLQIAPTLLSASNGIRKNIDLDAGTEYTFSYDIAAQTPLSNKNYILCELFYGTNALYSYKIMSTQSNSFVYTPTSSGTYTWRFRRVCTGATAPASSYTVDNLKVSYVIPYTRTECPETDLAYRFGFNGKEKESDIYGESNAYDFGARIHDARIGRFLSLDPLSKKFPSESNYSYAGNSPIASIDKDGKDKIYYLSYIHKDGHITTLEIVDERHVKIEYNSNGYFGVSVNTVDYKMNAVYDERTKKITYSNFEKQLGDEGVIEALYDNTKDDLEGEGGIHAGGFRLVSINGENVGDEPTKMKISPENTRDLMTLNFDDIADAMTAAGSKGKSAGLDGIADAVANAREMVKSYQDQDPDSDYQMNCKSQQSEQKQTTSGGFTTINTKNSHWEAKKDGKQNDSILVPNKPK